MKPVPVQHNDKRKIFIHKNLSTCSHVFLRVGCSKRSLQRPYNGPHKIISRINDRIFKIEINGKQKNVSVENLKPAFFLPDEKIPVYKNNNNIPKIPSNEIEKNKITTETNFLCKGDITIKTNQKNHPSGQKNIQLFPQKNSTKITEDAPKIIVESNARSILKRKNLVTVPKPLSSFPEAAMTPKISNQRDIPTKRTKFIPTILRRGPKKVTFEINSCQKCLH